MREGSLDAPTRHPIAWREADFYDPEKLDVELRRVFDICHGCRRCFNLCDSFPRLFDLVDESESGELDSVNSKDFAPIVEACTLCDMCFLTKCPYVPPHDFNLDFPHLMVRARAQAFRQGKIARSEVLLTQTDKNGKLGCTFSSLANWASQRGNAFTRPLMQALLGVHKDAELPPFSPKTSSAQAAAQSIVVNKQAPAFGRKAVIYATCFGEYNSADIVLDTRKVLARNGVETEVIHPGCCGMPQLEHGDIEAVAKSAKRVAEAFAPWIAKGYDIVAPVSSCALMVKFEWPLIEPDDAAIADLSKATFDAAEYMVAMAKKEGMSEGLKPLQGDVAIHIPCHARAQNMGQKGAELLRLIPDTKITVIERCSGHGGAWGTRTENFEVGMKIGKPVFRQATQAKPTFLVSECPLARGHILQGMEGLDEGGKAVQTVEKHPIQLIAKSYGL
ncbi:heterodisulfide reductase-related iron-sulfur binding cluster [Varunaivibrio sulfuroxidans]|uniref:Glycerol-3-phosphate dehydrogenase subunit C n=1 Tax=Varunaivibrio sulfuroxidans TaxID=1773489 RepID=A0A4R3JGN8_9PROT|nr:heterodisulfide reductase-related iron-sulfur binding cluster [Varunaivibrio sulfuroxidans]TCS65067.1 glycerol-3-phosphate dehydrogenase subunit C [Varunaivibrio sulfuroxidans]WES29646.1 heterodisulfide reductase-related iron-sulfur binding cluster [Varunaivibrio sulfuroxidans]